MNKNIQKASEPQPKKQIEIPAVKNTTNQNKIEPTAINKANISKPSYY